MPTVSKRQKRHQEVVRTQLKPLDEALGFVKQMAATKFRESVDVAINLGIDASKSDQAVRGSTVLPNGTGKVVKVAVFAQGDNVAKAKAAGADAVGFEDLAERMKGGEIDYDTVIATPDAMRIVGQLGRVLGPRGLMPNPKVGTVTTDVEAAVRNAKSGQVRYRTDKGGIVHCQIGKVDFEVAALRQNLMALLADIRKARPPQAKGQYLKRVTLSSTMGPGVGVDQSSLEEVEQA
jgi:large subunit ribosomal protein L1